MFISDNLSSRNGHLFFADQDTTELASQYGTPLYLMDEDRIRKNLNIYKTTIRKCFGKNSGVLYAGKACAFRQLYRILQEEEVGIDVVSAGEIHTAYQAGYNLENAFFHGNNKTDQDIAFALDRRVGYFVIDNEEEAAAVQEEAEKRRIKQKVLVRITPGIDTHTYEAVNTGKVDSKFGNAIATGQAEKLTEMVLGLPSLELKGFHCHVGSQVFTEDVFERAAEIMLEFMASIREKLLYTAEILDLGGGYGVRYTEDDPLIDIETKITDVAERIGITCDRLQYPVPAVLLEPGRSIVADAGLTLYTVGSVKEIPGYKNYISVDGGMADNPRYALYRSNYTCLPAGRMNEAFDKTYDVVGRCCESGDILKVSAALPKDMKRGDILAFCTTGAYNYSMASNYNRIPRPPVVMLKNRKSYVAVRRESLDDLTSLDV